MGTILFPRSVRIAELQLFVLERIWLHPKSGWRMSVDIKQLIAAREVERYQLHASHLNEQMVHVLKTIGFDKRYQRGIGQIFVRRAGREVSRPAQRMGRVRHWPQSPDGSRGSHGCAR